MGCVAPAPELPLLRLPEPEKSMAYRLNGPPKELLLMQP
jgi:hypothetical protein